MDNNRPEDKFAAAGLAFEKASAAANLTCTEARAAAHRTREVAEAAARHEHEAAEAAAQLACYLAEAAAWRDCDAKLADARRAREEADADARKITRRGRTPPPDASWQCNTALPGIRRSTRESPILLLGQIVRSHGARRTPDRATGILLRLRRAVTASWWMLMHEREYRTPILAQALHQTLASVWLAANVDHQRPELVQPMAGHLQAPIGCIRGDAEDRRNIP